MTTEPVGGAAVEVGILTVTKKKKGRGSDGSFSHFQIYFQKIQNKENKFMYTNTSKIEYVLYKICTAAQEWKLSGPFVFDDIVED